MWQPQVSSEVRQRHSDPYEASWDAVESFYGPVRDWAGDNTTELWRDFPLSFLDLLLARFRWWRRRRGGHWELWLMEAPSWDKRWFNPVQCCRRAIDGRVLRLPVGGFMPRRCEEYR